MKVFIRWTDEMLQDIKNFTNEKMTSIQVAEQISKKYSVRVNRNQIIGAARRNNIELFQPYLTKLQANGWTPDRVKKLKKLWENNIPITQIAYQMGISHNTVSNKVRKLGLNERNAQQIRQGSGLATKIRNSQQRELKVSLVKTELFKEFKSPIAKRKKFLELKRYDCRFIIGDGKPEDFVFCAAPAKPGSAYCVDCHNIVYYRPTHNLERLG